MKRPTRRPFAVVLLAGWALGCGSSDPTSPGSCTPGGEHPECDEENPGCRECEDPTHERDPDDDNDEDPDGDPDDGTDEDPDDDPNVPGKGPDDDTDCPAELRKLAESALDIVGEPLALPPPESIVTVLGRIEAEGSDGDGGAALRFAAEAGQWLSIDVLPLGRHRAAFSVIGPEGTEYHRASPATLDDGAQRSVLIPEAGIYSLRLVSAGDRDEPCRGFGPRDVVARIQAQQPPKARDTEGEISGDGTEVRANLARLNGVREDDWVSIELEELGSDVAAVLLIGSSLQAWGPELAPTAGGTLSFVAPVDEPLLLVDYVSSSGSDVGYKLRWKVECAHHGAPFGGGDGTEEEPYRICTPAHLGAIDASFSADHFRLTADLDLTGLALSPRPTFSGVFDGAWHRIQHFSYEGQGTQPVGLFTSISGAGVVRDLVLEHPDSAGASDAGPLAGSSWGTIRNVHVVGGSLRGYGSARIGGLVGYNNGEIASSSSSAEVTTEGSEAGGLVGDNDGTITRSTAAGLVLGGSDSLFIGGLVGRNYGDVFFSSATGNVGGTSRRAGGLIGSNAGNVSDSWASGNVAGASEYAGGLLGGGFAMGGKGSVLRSFATGSVTGAIRTGGLIGYIQYATIAESFATGAVSDLGGAAAERYVGGLVGDGQSLTVENCYALGNVTATSIGGGLLGRSSFGSTIRNSYAGGVVSGAGELGGLVGEGSAESMVGAYYRDPGEDSPLENGLGSPLQVANFAQSSSFVGWDFSEIWWMDAAASPWPRPILAWER